VRRRRLALAALVAAGLLGLAAAAGLTALLWPAAPPPPVPAEGEHLRYAVTFVGVEAGTLDLVAAKDRTSTDDALVVEMKIASTNRLLESVFRIRESWRSEIDPRGPFSRGFDLARRHGSKELADEQRHDYASGISTWRRREDGRELKGETPLTGPVQDPVSWIYYCRWMIARGERELRFVIVERDRVREAELEVTGTEEVDLGPLGKVKALRATGSVGLGGLGGGAKKNVKDSGVDQKASVMWFEAATGILVRARIAAKVGTMGLALRETRGAPEFGRGP